MNIGNSIDDNRLKVKQKIMQPECRLTYKMAWGPFRPRMTVLLSLQ